jgi:hypothetical protein
VLWSQVKIALWRPVRGGLAMSITLIGYGLLPLVLVPSVRLHRILTIFFIPFTATALVNIDRGSEYSTVSPYFYFAFAYALYSFLARLIRDGAVIRTKALMLSCFIILSVALSYVNLMLGSGFEVDSPILTDDESVTLVRDFLPYLPQFIYLLLGLVFMLILSAQMRNVHVRIESIRVFLFSVTFASFWGLYQILSYYLGYHYLTIFNSSLHEAAQGHQQFLGEIKRVSSVSVEPSIYSQVLIVALVFVALHISNGICIFTRTFDKFIFFLFGASLLITSSSSALVAIALFLLISPYYVFRNNYVKIILTPVYSVVFFILIYFSLNYFGHSKLDSYSAYERFKSVYLASLYFINSPLFGYGWGAVTSHDLVFRLLANVGLVGAFSFFLLFLFAYLNASGGVRFSVFARRRDDLAFFQASVISLLCLLSLFVVTGFPYYFGHLWLVLGFCFVGYRYGSVG